MVKPNLAFVNFFREQRGRRVVEVSDIIVPAELDTAWPRHHADFEKDRVYDVSWPHLPVEGSFSTEGQYEAHILCFGVTMEDLQHEAKSTGYKIPQSDVLKYQDVGLAPKPSKKGQSPDVKKSSRGRNLKTTKVVHSSAPVVPPSHSRKKKKYSEEDSTRRERNKEFAATFNSDVPFPDDVSESSAASENKKSRRNDSRGSVAGSNLKESRSKGHTVNEFDLGFDLFAVKTDTEVKESAAQASHFKKSPLKSSDNDQDLGNQLAIEKKSMSSKNRNSPLKSSNSQRHADGDRFDQLEKVQLLKASSEDPTNKRWKGNDSRDSHANLHIKSSDLRRSASAGKAAEHDHVSHHKSPVNEKTSRKHSDEILVQKSKSPLRERSRLEEDPVGSHTSNFDCLYEYHDEMRYSFSDKETVDINDRNRTGRVQNEDKRTPKKKSVDSCLESPTRSRKVSLGSEYDAANDNDFQTTSQSGKRKRNTSRGSSKRNYRESSTDSEEASTSQNSSDGKDEMIQLYINKIFKLERELKAVKRDNVMLKEKLAHPPDTDIPFSPRTPKSNPTAQTSSDKSQKSKSAKRSLTFEENCDYADNATISDMILDAINNKAPLRADGEGKLHIGNGVYISSKIFEDKIKSLKVSPSIAMRDVMGNVYTTSQLSQRSLEGGTPVKGGADRKKHKKLKLTPKKRECFLGIYRAKTALKTGSKNKEFLELSVTKGGRSTIRDRVEGSCSVRLKEQSKEQETRTKQVSSGSGAE